MTTEEKIRKCKECRCPYFTARTKEYLKKTNRCDQWNKVSPAEIHSIGMNRSTVALEFAKPSVIEVVYRGGRDEELHGYSPDR